jgi:hypothetical protein
MNKAQIFFTFRETAKIESIINQITENNDYTKKIEIYMTTKSQQFIKFHNKNIDVRQCQFYTMPYLPRYLFATVYTKTNTNHPYLLFFNLDDIYLTFLIPFGGDHKQADMSTYFGAIDESNLVELTAILVLLEKTIYIRKLGIVDSKQFSLVNCSNISNCVKKIHEIDKMRISVLEKQNLKNKYNEYYLYKAVEFLKYYFDLLDTRNFNEALLFLKGGDSKHFGKQRLNTFFKNTQTIIGHLEIFISLYELYYTTKDKVVRQ